LRIFRDYDRFMVYQIKQLLDANGIPCYLKNEFISGAIGEVSPLDSQPEVWLMDDEWKVRAQSLIDNHLAEYESRKTQADWQCRQCSEVNDASFDVCWQCETPSGNQE